MLNKFLVEVEFSDCPFNLDEIKRINEDVQEISKDPFPGDSHGLFSKFKLLNEYVNESALGETDKDSSINLKYRLIEVRKTSMGKGIDYILEDWLGTNKSRSFDKKKILWGRRIYNKK
jgi:hypothetical protein